MSPDSTLAVAAAIPSVSHVHPSEDDLAPLPPASPGFIPQYTQQMTIAKTRWRTDSLVNWLIGTVRD